MNPASALRPGSRRGRLVALELFFAVAGGTAGLAQVVVDLSVLACLREGQAPWSFGERWVADAARAEPNATAVRREGRVAGPVRERSEVAAAATAVVAVGKAPPIRVPSAADSEILMPILRAITFGNLVLDNFGSTTRTGDVRANTSWVGHVTQNAGSLSVTGLARDDNGWGVTGLSLDATGMNYLTVVAQRDAGNAAPSLRIQFEDRNLNTQVYSIDTSLFLAGVLTPVQIPLGAWNPDFISAQISGWNIGGGGLGTVDFRLTFDHLEFSATSSAVPEPGTVALWAGLGVLSFAAYRRRHP